ncbi:PorV/PorQ family protein [Rubrivirga sp. IMCC43871]|uniref:PorV/PorQ family protein n=1 Tax=Rubrivirga sp. IMCC43871 TaxID=3391575 RepID=UPI00399031DE
MPTSALPRFALLALLALLVAPVARGQQVEERDKLAQSGMKFLSVSADPRAAGLGGAATALSTGAEALFYNPAGLSRSNASTGVFLGQTNFIADITYNHGAVSFRPAGGRFGVLGVSLMAVDYGELQETVFDGSTEAGYRDLGTFSPTAFAVGLGYARTVTDRFSVGGQVKMVTEDFGAVPVSATDEGGLTREDVSETVLAYDFGVMYDTPFQGLAFAVSARNFSQQAAFGEGEGFQLPLTLQIGAAFDTRALTGFDPSVHRLVFAVDAEDPYDATSQIEAGGEYTFANTFSLRGGYVFPSDLQSFSLGAGIRQRLGGVGFGADYSYSAYDVFDPVHRIAVRFDL